MKKDTRNHENNNQVSNKMAPQNRALLLKEKQSPVMVVGDAAYSKPASDEVVIKTKAVAINPADIAIQNLGILVEKYPAILGCDAAGVVEEVGSDITDFKPGDRVMGAATPLKEEDGVYKYASFQEYVVLKMPQIAKLPATTSFEAGTVLPLAVATALSCLFVKEMLGLELPPGKSGKGTLVLWGASSSVGSVGVQLAKAAGYEVVAIASKRNHDFVKSVGAAQAFDYGDPNLVDDVVAYVKGKNVVGAFDAISTGKTLPYLCDILDRCGGRKFIASVMPGADAHAKNDVEVKTNFAHVEEGNPISTHVWRKFMEPALADGTMQCKPSEEVVGHGLESIQKACDLLTQGVSAKKLVVSI